MVLARRLHNSVQQHLRALKAMGDEPSGTFITSMLELKLDEATMFEWQKASQDCSEVPHYKKLLEFLNLRAQASETKRNTRPEYKKIHANPRQIPTHVGNVYESFSSCVACKEKHPLYTCPKFKALPHDKMSSVVRSNNLCLNCFRPGHMSRSIHRCKRCQRSHHTLLHTEAKESPKETEISHTANVVSGNAQAGSNSNTLLMTCRVLVHAQSTWSPSSGSSTSFISQRLVQSLGLQRSSKNLQITGIAGISHNSPLHSISTFQISPTFSPSQRIPVTAVVVPRVQPVPLDSKWEHLSELTLSDPEFDRPGKIDMLLGVDIYADVLLQGRRKGPIGSPVAFETKFGWMLAGKTDKQPTLQNKTTTYHVNVDTGDDILRRFWEIEENPKAESNFSPQELTVVRHFNTRNEDGRFVVPLPKNPQYQGLKRYAGSRNLSKDL